MPDFDKLKLHVEKLNALLDDREPGLTTWCHFVAEHWMAISEMWIGPKSKTAPEP